MPNNSFYGKKLGSRIQLLRKGMSMTLAQLGNKTGVTHVQIRNYESGEQIPNAVIIVRIAEALDTTVEYLIKGDDGNISKSLVPKIERLSTSDQEALLRVIEGFLKSRDFLNLAESDLK